MILSIFLLAFQQGADFQVPCSFFSGGKKARQLDSKSLKASAFLMWKPDIVNLSWSVPGGCSCLASVTIKGVYKRAPYTCFFQVILPSYAYILGGFKP